LLRSKLEKKIFPFVESYQIKGTRSNPTICNCPSPFIKKRKIGLEECRKCTYRILINEFNVVCGAKNYIKIREILQTELAN
jgi:hypothetical protein